MATAIHAYRAFGLQIESDFVLDGLEGAQAAPDLAITMATGEDVIRMFSGSHAPPRVGSRLLGDGCQYTVERGEGGDLAITYGDRARFHVDADARVIRCAPEDGDAFHWRRFLLDTVLGTVSLVRGNEALHAGAVLVGDRVVGVSAASGGGKSTLISTLVRRGFPWFTDDVLVVRHDRPRVVALPGPPLMNLDGEPGTIGRVIACVDGERWVAVDRPPVEPSEVQAIVFLDRGDHRAPIVEPLGPDVARLLQHSLMSGPESERLATRFDVFADLAAGVQLLRLRAPMTTTPDELADLVVSATDE